MVKSKFLNNNIINIFIFIINIPFLLYIMVINSICLCISEKTSKQKSNNTNIITKDNKQ